MRKFLILSTVLLSISACQSKKEKGDVITSDIEFYDTADSQVVNEIAQQILADNPNLNKLNLIWANGHELVTFPVLFSDLIREALESYQLESPYRFAWSYFCDRTPIPGIEMDVIEAVNNDIPSAWTSTVHVLKERCGGPAMGDITDARAYVDKSHGYCNPIINFNAEDAKRFALLTKENLNKPLAFVINDSVMMAPIIRETITSGGLVLQCGLSEETSREFVKRITRPVDNMR